MSSFELWQVTTEERHHSNIYCETPYASRDSRYFVYERSSKAESLAPGPFGSVPSAPTRLVLWHVERPGAIQKN